MATEAVSAPVRDLIRRAAQLLINAPPEWLDEYDTAVLDANPLIAADPELSAAVSQSNRANLYFWATANIRAPGAPVPPNTGPEPLIIARELVRRGLDGYALDAYRVGQAMAWRKFMDVAFELTSDPAELHELLDVSSRSVGEFVDVTLARIASQIESERDELTRGTHAERRETVSLILDGAPIAQARAEARLGYALTGAHTAAVLWTGPDADLRNLERAAEAFGRVGGGGPGLTVVASTATRWTWVPGREVDSARLRTALDAMPEIRAAVGPTAHGIEGFRRSHFDALTTQQMMTRLQSSQHVAFFGEVELTAIVTQDPERADGFVNRTLGALAHADTELQDTVRIFVTEQCNASRAAARLYLHRNTLLRRLARADELLPRPLRECGVEVAVALDVIRWRGGPADGPRQPKATSR